MHRLAVRPRIRCVRAFIERMGTNMNRVCVIEIAGALEQVGEARAGLVREQGELERPEIVRDGHALEAGVG